VLESGTRVQKNVSHLFPHHTQKQVDIVITKDNFQTLVDVVIVNQIHTNLVQRASMMIVHVTTIVVQNKARSYT
jgi:hypothetical protein